MEEILVGAIRRQRIMKNNVAIFRLCTNRSHVTFMFNFAVPKNHLLVKMPN